MTPWYTEAMDRGSLRGVELQLRDWALLRGLLESRVMTLAHAGALYFDGKREMAKKRVQKLKAAGVVRERPRQFSEPSVLFLPPLAFNLLNANGHLGDYPKMSSADFERRAQVSPLTLRHELAVMDVKVAMISAIRATPGYDVAEFSTWPALSEFKACRPDGKRAVVRPDGFLRVSEQELDGGVSEHAFFLEVDRSTEVLDVLCQRCYCYLDYYRTGQFAVRHGGSREECTNYPFRVLVICKSAQRRDNVSEQLRTSNPPIRTFVWLATQQAVYQDPLGPIWFCPVDQRSTSSGPAGRRLLFESRDPPPPSS
jgi:hypothetical protein